MIKINLITLDKPKKNKLYEIMSITKGAVGLAFLCNSSINLNTKLENTSITLEEALCHQTGLQNDESFNYKEYMEYSKNQNVYQYAKNIFLEDYHSNYVTSKYEYNNIVWRLLIEYYKNITGIKPSDFLITIDGLSNLEFIRDNNDKGLMHGLNGILMSCEMIKSYAFWAKTILIKNKSNLLKYKPIHKNTWVSKVIDNNKINIHPFFGWFIIAKKDCSKLPIVAISIGFMSQFICIDLFSNFETGIQLRDPYWKDFSKKSHEYAKNYVNNIVMLNCDVK
mgnify:CR=1 FL=1